MIRPKTTKERFRCDIFEWRIYEFVGEDFRSLFDEEVATIVDVKYKVYVVPPHTRSTQTTYLFDV